MSWRNQHSGGRHHIGASAFNKCKGLIEITIPATVTEIEDSAFDSCNGLTTVTISEGVTAIGKMPLRLHRTDGNPIQASLRSSLMLLQIAKLTQIGIPSVTKMRSGPSKTVAGWRRWQFRRVSEIEILPSTAAKVWQKSPPGRRYKDWKLYFANVVV